jgi:hypothetical protein
MSDRGKMDDWGERPSRARQPLGPSGIEQRRARGLQRATRSVRRIHPQDQNALEASARGPEGGMRRPGQNGRSRFVAIVVLISVAVIVTIGGIVASTGGISSGSSVPVSILPFPQSTDTTIAQ